MFFNLLSFLIPKNIKSGGQQWVQFGEHLKRKAVVVHLIVEVRHGVTNADQGVEKKRVKISQIPVLEPNFQGSKLR